MKPATLCVQTDHNDQYGSVSPPIYQTATFEQTSATEFGEFDYTRSGNPNRDQAERKIAQLEHAEYAAAFSSGMAAITAITRLLKQGDEILAGEDLYGGCVRLLERIVPRLGISVRYADSTDSAAIEAAISEKTRLILVETPSNPFLKITDIKTLALLAHASDALFAVDNTMLSPCLQNPLDLGADLVVHSATKFLCGHSDVTAGVVATNRFDLYEQIAFVQNAEGSGLAPFDCWLLGRGLKTLALRVERQNASAQAVAEFLAGHRVVKEVFYPGLSTHAGRDVHFRQARGGGSVVSFTTGDLETSRRLAEATRLSAIAVSFGSVNSTVSLPCYMSHASVPAELRGRLAPPPDLVRFSVGIEDVEDIIEDLRSALEIAERGDERTSAQIAGR